MQNIFGILADVLVNMLVDFFIRVLACGKLFHSRDVKCSVFLTDYASYKALCEGEGPEPSRDLCTVMKNLCPNGICISLPGSFRCQCNPGFKLDASGACVGMTKKCFV